MLRSITLVRVGWITRTTMAWTFVAMGSCASPLPDIDGNATDTTSDASGSAESTNADDTSTAPECGNGSIDASEECDGATITTDTCETLGFDGGTLSCSTSCTYDTSGCYGLPDEPVLELSFSPVKQFEFGWGAVAAAEHYQLLESPAPGEPYAQLGEDVVGESISIEMPLHLRWDASYELRACNGGGCTSSATVSVEGSLAEAVGYVKASNANGGDYFGWSVALSDDGNTLAIGAYEEASSATGIGNDQDSDAAGGSGAVYVFVQDDRGAWSQQAYVKASNTDAYDHFGHGVALSADGNTLAVGAPEEDSSATGIAGDQSDDSADGSGAVYVFARGKKGAWSQQAYLKASNTGTGDRFGVAVALSGGGSTLAVGASGEASSAAGIGGDQADDSVTESGAVYVFERDDGEGWSQQAYVKASNTGTQDLFGNGLALSGDGSTLAVGAPGEASNVTGIDGNQDDESASSSGAVYVFERDGVRGWSQQAYVKASNTGVGDSFGWSLALSGDGSTLAVGAPYEDSNATGIGGNQTDDSSDESGAVYVLGRDGTGAWSQQAYVKASNSGAGDYFGWSLALSEDSSALAVGARYEDGSATGVSGDQTDAIDDSGAAYVFERNELRSWSLRAYVKASNTGDDDSFGWSVALSGAGDSLAVGARNEDSNATGIGGGQADESADSSGAVYLY